MKSRPCAVLLLLASFTASRSWSLDGARLGPLVPAGLSLGTLQWDQKRAFAIDAHGQRHRLTLDHDLQTAVMAQLRRARARHAAAVLLSVNDGRVLAAAETPLANHSESMLWSAVTPSASLFKLITTTALIERGKLQPDHRVCSEGGEHRLELQHLTAPTAGRVVCANFSEILASSRNASYARLVHSHLTAEDLGNFADRFGFNAPLWADVNAELGRFHVANDPLTVARTATGFVGSSLSVLGASYIGYVIAKGGIASSIRFFDDEPESVEMVAEGTPAPSSASVAIDARHAAPSRVMTSLTATRLRDMMERVVNYGTAADAFRDASSKPLLPHVRIAGKTGTLGRSEGTASWFIGFAPSRDPKLVIAVLLDNGALWHVTAKRVAAAIL
ncbi:MAG TPA: penicillin-binding transpeptidase domain-containing protein, partial [Polyangiaceae bacterium]